MKRILKTILTVAGMGGLIAVLSYHPKTSASASDATASSPDSGTTLSQSEPASSAPAASTPVSTPVSTPAPAASGSGYRNGTYAGPAVDVGYGTVQVAAVISGGRLTAVQFLQMPFDAERSAAIASAAKPLLQQEALAAQSANVDVVTGATSDSEGFVQSLQSALNKAKA